MTYYGEVGRSYELDLFESRNLHPPFVCQLTFVAAGDIYGDLVQILFRDMDLGTFRSHHVFGCPQGMLSINEARKPHVPGFWCGGTNEHTVYYSETSTVTVTFQLPQIKDEFSTAKPFRAKILYKFLLGAKSVVRFGPWNSAKYLGFPRPGSICDKVFDSCDRRKCRIQSPNYPGIYPRNVTCQYIVRQATVPHGRHALVSVAQPQNGLVHIKHTDGDCTDELNMELDSTCDVVGDTLSIYEINGETRRLLLRFCGGGKIPRVTASGSQILLVFHTSPYDNMHFDPSIRTYPGFELDVGVAFVPKNSFLYADETCEFTISSYENPAGQFENVAHSLPRDTKCKYKFKGRPDEVVWLYFTRLTSLYSLPQSRDTPHCLTQIKIIEGNDEIGPFLENTCRPTAVKICHREQLGPGKNRTRPCSSTESYLATTSQATLIIHYIEPSAVANFDFRLHYEFVYAGPKAEALEQLESCDRIITSQRSKKGLVASPANNLLYGKFGRSNLKCKYQLVGKENEVVRITVISFYAHNSSCQRQKSPLQSCDRLGNLYGRRAQLEISEHLWKGIKFSLACVCHGYNIPAAVMSFSSSLTVEFSVTGMSLFDDFSHFSFELEYDFVAVRECKENRIITGEAGILSLQVNPSQGPCRGHPWLLKPRSDKYLLLSIPGYSINEKIEGEPYNSFIPIENIFKPKHCKGPKLYIYQPANPEPLSTICIDPNSVHKINVFSKGFSDPWSLDYLNTSDRSLIVVLISRPQFISESFSFTDYSSVDIRWVEASPLWQITRCATECPDVHACISASLFCDGSWHCPSGADESLGTCLLALSPWLWMLFGIVFGSILVAFAWWVTIVWKKHQPCKNRFKFDIGFILAPKTTERPNEHHECEYPSCLDVNYETTV